jgi:hypothetical protein
MGITCEFIKRDIFKILRKDWFWNFCWEAEQGQTCPLRSGWTWNGSHSVRLLLNEWITYCGELVKATDLDLGILKCLACPKIEAVLFCGLTTQCLVYFCTQRTQLWLSPLGKNSRRRHSHCPWGCLPSTSHYAVSAGWSYLTKWIQEKYP